MGLRKFKQTGFAESHETPLLLEPHALELALCSTDPVQRRHSIWCARSCLATTQVLLQHLAVEHDVQVLEALFVALSQSAGEEVVPTLLDLLSSEDVLNRNRALEVLAGFTEQVGQLMAQHLQSGDADKRIFLVNLMAELKHPQVAQWIQDILLRDPHINVVAAALEVAAEVGDAQTVAAIDVAVQRFADDAFIGFAAEIARQRIGVQ